MKTLKNILFWENDPQNSRNNRNRAIHWTVNILALLAWSCVLGILALAICAAGTQHRPELFDSYLANGMIVFLNILPVFFVVAIAYFISNRVWIAYLSSGLFIIILSFVNYFKLKFRGDPFMASDIRYISEAAEIGTGYNIAFNKVVIFSLAGLVVATVIAFFLFRAKMPKFSAKWMKPALRAFGAVASAAVLILLATTTYSSEKVYAKTANIEPNKAFMSYWSDTDQYVSRGFLYSLLHSIEAARDNPPDGYSAKRAESQLGEYTYDDIPEDKQVNVISIMLEAYNDLSKFDALEFENDPYDFFHQLQSESVSGELVTNIFAGGTIDSERTFLTGYETLYEYRGTTNSYVWYFRDQGYTTEGGHPGYAWFYNRANVMEYFGFENYYFYETRYETKEGYIMRDPEFFSDIITLYEENKLTGKPYFNFSLTYQNHGPYDSDECYAEQEYVRNTSFSEESYNILNNYLSGIDKTDGAIEQLISYFAAEDEPVVVILYGDHNPWLGDNNSVYHELGIDISRVSDESVYNYYCTPYIIWANDAAKETLDNDFVCDGGDFSPMFLMNKLFEIAGWGGNEYMKATNELFEYTDIVHVNGIYREDGVLVSDPAAQAKAALEKFRNIQYYWRRG